jgi:hypothetical protein
MKICHLWITKRGTYFCATLVVVIVVVERNKSVTKAAQRVRAILSSRVSSFAVIWGCISNSLTNVVILERCTRKLGRALVFTRLLVEVVSVSDIDKPAGERLVYLPWWYSLTTLPKRIAEYPQLPQANSG